MDLKFKVMEIETFDVIYRAKEAELKRDLLPQTSLENIGLNHQFLFEHASRLLDASKNPNALAYFGLLNRELISYDIPPPNRIRTILPCREYGIEFFVAIELMGRNMQICPDIGETVEDVEELLEARRNLTHHPQVKDLQMRV